MPDELRIIPVGGLPEFRPGDDLPATIAKAAPWLVDDDVVVVTSKVVSKVEGHLVPTPTDPEQREQARRQAVVDQARRVVARHGRTTITETHHGFVLAASGVDASNVRADELALLPPDPDRSARSIRRGLRDRLGVTVAVVVSDTLGRPWRAGLTDVAIGAAGLTALRDHRGRTDAHGNELVVTEIADADQIAAAAELVKGKLDGIPVAVVRGLRPVDDARGASTLVRPAEQDMFRLGTRDVVGARTDTSTYADRPVDPTAVQRAVAAAATAIGSGDWRLVHVADPVRRQRLLTGEPVGTDGGGDSGAAGADGGGADSSTGDGRSGGCGAGDGTDSPEVFVLALPHDPGPDGWLAAGAALQNVLVQLTAEGLGTAWRPIATADRARTSGVLDLPPHLVPVGAVTAGHPQQPIGARDLPAAGERLLER